MSVWDDSWGACDARGARGDRGTIGGSGTGRCVNTDPSLAPAASLDLTEEHTVAFVHILRSLARAVVTRRRTPRTADPGVVQTDEDVCVCTWQRWEHYERPERCDLMGPRSDGAR